MTCFTRLDALECTRWDEQLVQPDVVKSRVNVCLSCSSLPEFVVEFSTWKRVHGAKKSSSFPSSQKIDDLFQFWDQDEVCRERISCNRMGLWISRVDLLQDIHTFLSLLSHSRLTKDVLWESDWSHHEHLQSKSSRKNNWNWKARLKKRRTHFNFEKRTKNISSNRIPLLKAMTDVQEKASLFKRCSVHKISFCVGHTLSKAFRVLFPISRPSCVWENVIDCLAQSDQHTQEILRICYPMSGDTERNDALSVSCPDVFIPVVLLQRFTLGIQAKRKDKKRNNMDRKLMLPHLSLSSQTVILDNTKSGDSHLEMKRYRCRRQEVTQSL